jgi:hypothetical protein
LAPGFAVYVPDAASAVDELNATVQTLTSFVPAHYVPQFLWGAAPEAGRPFVLIGQSPAVTTPARIDDGRLLAGAPNPTLELSSFSDGMIIETATSASGAGGLVLDYAGAPGQIPLPTFGTESARVVTAQGSFVVNGDGTIAPTSPPRANSPR